MRTMTERAHSRVPWEVGSISPREQGIARIALVVASLSYVAAQLSLLPADRPPGWDESVYLSQVMPDVPAVFFDAWRARGLPLLIAPAAWLGSIEAVRVFLTVSAAGAMTLALWVWIPLIGLAAPIAAVGSSFSWLALVNGSEVMPNLWAAILGLATIGSVARSFQSDCSRHEVLAATMMAATALVRPTEATVVAGVVAVHVLLLRRSSWRVLLAVGVGLVAGWLPWLIEMSVRFGGPLEAVREAATGHFGSPNLAENMHRHLAYTGGNLQSVEVPMGGVVWWGVLATMGVVGLARASRGRDADAPVIASLGTLAFGTEYLVFGAAAAPRFLIPAYVFGSLAAAIGVVSLLRAGPAPRQLGILVLLLALPWAIWQGGAAERLGDGKAGLKSSYRVVGVELRALVGGRSCAFVSPFGYPEIQLASRCEGADIVDPAGPTARELGRLLEEGADMSFVVLPRRAAPGSTLRDRVATEIRTERRAWFVYPVSTALP